MAREIIISFFLHFFEFGLKNIKATVSDTLYGFDVLSYTLGGRYAFHHEFEVKQGEETVSRSATFSLIPYVHFLNVANEDNEAYRKIFNQTDLPSVLVSWGIKVVAQYHHFGIYADFKNMFDNGIKNPDIKGFNSNIGIVISADLIQF